MFSLIRDWINGWANSFDAGDLRRHPAHYDVTVLIDDSCVLLQLSNPAMTELEVITIDWLAKLLQLPKAFLSEGKGGGVIQVVSLTR